MDSGHILQDETYAALGALAAIDYLSEFPYGDGPTTQWRTERGYQDLRYVAWGHMAHAWRLYKDEFEEKVRRLRR